MKKVRDLLIILGIYLLAFVVAFLICFRMDDVILKFFLFDIIATVIVFIFSVVLHNSSVYDPYWSFTPMVMAIWLFIEAKAGSAMQIVFLAVFLLWGVRLTVNWIGTFTDFSYEDWRYRKYRAESSRLLWPIVNFGGIHMVPTLVVFAGMLPLFELVRLPLDWRILPGIAVMLFGICMEYFADRQMHAFLRGNQHREVCRRGLWKYSRHPNYLGEISFWLGVFLSMILVSAERWYYVIGFVAMAVLFLVVSIPLMDKRQLARRPQYREYRAVTSPLLLLPPKKRGQDA